MDVAAVLLPSDDASADLSELAEDLKQNKESQVNIKKVNLLQ